MTLGFSLNINGKPSYFPEKVLGSLKHLAVDENISRYINSEYCAAKKLLNVKPKLHTIREDKSNRWKEGMDIHFVINNRTENRMQFAPVVKCMSVQEIEILPDTRMVLLPVTDSGAFLLEDKAVEELAINDGFDSLEDFWAYFKEPFQGKIIHWTDKRY